MESSMNDLESRMMDLCMKSALAFDLVVLSLFSTDVAKNVFRWSACTNFLRLPIL